MLIEEYEYKNAPIPGGGYVTGFAYHEKEEGLLYLRTDIGGTYRWNPAKEEWESLVDHVTMEDLRETFPISIALVRNHPEKMLVASGTDDKDSFGCLSISNDRGRTFIKKEMPMFVHGNLNGRGTDERLLVSEKTGKLYMASQQDGLWVSKDEGDTWAKLMGMQEDYLTFVSEIDGALLVGTAGVTTMSENGVRGHGLYLSNDEGETFEKVTYEENRAIPEVEFAGLVPHRICRDEKYLYITFACNGRHAYAGKNGFSCDGGSTIEGRVYRFEVQNENGKIHLVNPKNISPIKTQGILECGFGGINVAKTRPGMVCVATICKDDGDCIFRSYDYGENWECILKDLEIGKMDFHTSYMRPEYNGGRNIIHWLTDLKINPFDENEMWFNTGTGVFRTRNLTEKEVVFEDACKGLEETVHLNVYAPPSGEVQLIDILGDLGGFAFKNLEKDCRNSFDDAEGNRYITCINADYCDENPKTIWVTPRGNWKGKTKGGLICSKDGCESFQRIDLPYGISKELDEAFHAIETPNVNSGWVALSSDAKTVVWNVAQDRFLPVSRVIVSHDEGNTFGLVSVFYKNKERKTQGGFKVFSDRVNPNLFYGFDESGKMYISKNAGDCFEEVTFQSGKLPEETFALIDTSNKADVRVESGKSGSIYICLGESGLWKVQVNEEDLSASLRRLGGKNAFYRIGLGVGRDGDYFSGRKTIYTVAKIEGIYGFYRTENDGETFTRINALNQMFGDINALDGDKRVFGRFYIGTGTRGVLYGGRKNAF